MLARTDDVVRTSEIEGVQLSVAFVRLSIARRLGAAATELEIGKHYSYVVVNDDVDRAVEHIAAILTAEHCRIERNIEFIDELEKGKGK